MKKVLRNLALATAVLVAGSASAQTLTKVWEQDAAGVGSTWGGELRFNSGVDGKLIANDKANYKVVYWDAENSYQVLHDLKSFFETNENLHTWSKAIDRIDTIVGAENDSTFDTIYKDVQTLDPFGCGIAVDDAGNIIVNTNFPNGPSATEYIIIPADGSDYIYMNLDLTTWAVDGKRNDHIGKVVGNMLSEEGAYMWIPMANGGEQVMVVKIVNGEVDYDYTMPSTSIGAMNTSDLIQPAVETIDEVNELAEGLGDTSPTFWKHRRNINNTIAGWDFDGETATWNASKVTLKDGLNTSGNEGFAAFKLQDKWYFVVPVNARATGNFAVYDETGENIAIATDTKGAGSGQYQSFSAEKVDDYTVNIYVWVPTFSAAMYTFAVAQPTPEVEPLYMVGQVNGNNWDITNPVEIPWNATSQCYEANLTIDGAEFKFSEVSGNGDWEAFNAKAICIADDQLVEYGNKAELWKYSGTNCKFGSSIEVGKEYNIKISVIEGSDVKGGYILVSESTGVENVEVEANAPAVYYNLQGVEVANPENGLYIVKQGNKVSKVLVK